MNARQTSYGTFPIGRDDIRERPCCTIDLRRETGGWEWRDHNGEDIDHPAGHPFQLSVFATGDGVPVAEVLMIYDGQEVSIVGHPTGRPGVMEVTPDHLRGAMGDAQYRATLVAYIGGAS